MILRLADPIIHQTQPTPNTCTQTCIAMAVGIPVEQLGVVLENGVEFEDFGVWLAERGIWLRYGIRSNGRGESPMQGGVYILGVRSLNNVGGDHAVLLDARGEPTNGNPRSGWKFFDPNVGRDGVKTYRWIDPGEIVDFCELRQRDGRHVDVGAPP